MFLAIPSSFMNFRALLTTAICLFAIASSTLAESLPADHPTAAIVKQYLEAVVKQDWKTAADMLLPVSLERRRTQMVASIKNSNTMTEEAAKLNMLGVKDTGELEKMTPQQARILQLVSEGNTNAEIAEKLSLAEATVKFHLGDIFKRLNARGRAHAVAIAISLEEILGLEP